MLQREEKDAPSDFQDYTLLALVAVSAFLSNVNLGERNGLVVLAQKYDQDVEPLQQVQDQTIVNMARLNRNPPREYCLF